MANPTGKGGFRKGFDPRRYLLTQADCKRGYANAPSRIRSRIRSMYRGFDGKTKIVKKGRIVWAELAM